MWSKVSSFLIKNPPFVLMPFVLLLYGGFHWRIGLLLTGAFLYLGAWCTYRHTRCGTPPCGITGPLFLLVALFSLLRWVPPFASSALAWSNWDHLFLVVWIGTTAAFGSQWLATRRWGDAALTAGFLTASLAVYAAH